jgi:hypothetical protein
VALYRGEGGAIFEMDPPPEGSNRRELFDAQLESGRLTLVEAPKATKKAAPAAADTVQK